MQFWEYGSQTDAKGRVFVPACFRKTLQTQEKIILCFVRIFSRLSCVVSRFGVGKRNRGTAPQIE